MRPAVLIPVLLALVAGGCATREAPPPKLSATEAHEECAGRMYAARARGAVHWHIYENCLKGHQ